MFPTIHRFDVIFIKNPEIDDANIKCRHQEKTSSSQNFQQKCLKQTWGQKDFDARKLRFVQKIPKKTFLWAVSRHQSFTFGENILLHYLVKVYFLRFYVKSILAGLTFRGPMIFLSFRFYVKSILRILEIQNLSF